MSSTESPPTLVAFDTESATSRGAPHLLELAAVRFQDGEERGHFSRLVRPEVPIEREAFAVHGIADEDVRDAEDSASVLAAFASFVGDDPLIAHDMRADGWVLGFEHARHRVGTPGSILLDSLSLARQVWPALDDHRLATVAEHLELETAGMHRALFDATLCWQVVEAAVATLGGWSAVGLAKLVSLAGSKRTLAETGPRRPNRRPSLVRALERAAGEEASLRLIYGEGEGAAAVLPVRPRWVYQVKQRGYLEAECLASGELKTYRLDRVRRVEAMDPRR